MKKVNRTAEQLVVVSNIASELRSADLRGFFSEWVEASRFRCFHYQHRKMELSGSSEQQKRCCLVRLLKRDAAAFIGKYDGQRWLRTTRVSAFDYTLDWVKVDTNTHTQTHTHSIHAPVGVQLLCICV